MFNGPALESFSCAHNIFFYVTVAPLLQGWEAQARHAERAGLTRLATLGYLYRVTIYGAAMTPGKKEIIPDYQAMAELRYRVRCFLRFSEEAARGSGLEPQQHQLLLALKGLPQGQSPTIGFLAERLQIQHHSTVELVDRLVGKGMVRRYRSRLDRRRVYVRLTRSGEEVLKKLSLHHMEELQSVGPTMVRVLSALMVSGTTPLSRGKDQGGNELISTGQRVKKTGAQ